MSDFPDSEYGQDIKPLKPNNDSAPTPKAKTKSYLPYLIAAFLLIDFAAAGTWYYFYEKDEAEVTQTTKTEITEKEEPQITQPVKEVVRFSEEFSGNYLTSCKLSPQAAKFAPEQVDAYCSCTLSGIEENYSQVEYEKIEAEIQKSGKATKEVEQITTGCYKEHLQA